MSAMDDPLARLQEQAAKQAIRVTQHAQQAMDAEEITSETVRKIESLRHTAAPPTRTVPLYDFAEVKSA